MAALIRDPVALLARDVCEPGGRYPNEDKKREHGANRHGELPMSDLQAIADRVAIEALRGEFTDAAMVRDYDRFASLFTQDGAWRLPYVNVEFVGRAQIRAGIERAQEALWDFFVQNTHPGTVELEGDTALGRAYIFEFGRMRDGRSQAHYALYHDRYERTRDGWRFAERVYEIRYVDTTQPAGSPPAPGTSVGTSIA